MFIPVTVRFRGNDDDSWHELEELISVRDIDYICEYVPNDTSGRKSEISRKGKLEDLFVTETKDELLEMLNKGENLDRCL